VDQLEPLVGAGCELELEPRAGPGAMNWTSGHELELEPGCAGRSHELDALAGAGAGTQRMIALAGAWSLEPGERELELRAGVGVGCESGMIEADTRRCNRNHSLSNLNISRSLCLDHCHPTRTITHKERYLEHGVD